MFKSPEIGHSFRTTGLNIRIFTADMGQDQLFWGVSFKCFMIISRNSIDR